MLIALALIQGVDETSAAYKSGQYTVYILAAVGLIVVLYYLMRSKKK